MYKKLFTILLLTILISVNLIGVINIQKVKATEETAENTESSEDVSEHGIDDVNAWIELCMNVPETTNWNDDLTQKLVCGISGSAFNTVALANKFITDVAVNAVAKPVERVWDFILYNIPFYTDDETVDSDGLNLYMMINQEISIGPEKHAKRVMMDSYGLTPGEVEAVSLNSYGRHFEETGITAIDQANKEMRRMQDAYNNALDIANRQARLRMQTLPMTLFADGDVNNSGFDLLFDLDLMTFFLFEPDVDNLKPSPVYGSGLANDEKESDEKELAPGETLLADGSINPAKFKTDDFGNNNGDDELLEEGNSLDEDSNSDNDSEDSNNDNNPATCVTTDADVLISQIEPNELYTGNDQDTGNEDDNNDINESDDNNENITFEGLEENDEDTDEDDSEEEVSESGNQCEVVWGACVKDDPLSSAECKEKYILCVSAEWGKKKKPKPKLTDNCILCHISYMNKSIEKVIRSGLMPGKHVGNLFEPNICKVFPNPMFDIFVSYTPVNMKDSQIQEPGLGSNMQNYFSRFFIKNDLLGDRKNDSIKRISINENVVQEIQSSTATNSTIAQINQNVQNTQRQIRENIQEELTSTNLGTLMDGKNQLLMSLYNELDIMLQYYINMTIHFDKSKSLLEQTLAIKQCS